MDGVEIDKTLYIFLDESGNFDFSPKGTKYFALTAISTMAPLKSREDLLRRVYGMKYLRWAAGEKDYYFHATEDTQADRDLVFSAIKSLDDFEIDSVVAQKNKANPSLYIRYEVKPNGKGFGGLKTVHSEEKFYDKVSQILLQYILGRHHGKKEVEKIVIVLGSLFTDSKRGYVLKSLKSYLKEKFQKPFHIYFQSTSTDINCQIADYCGWAVFVASERGEMRPLGEIKNKLKSKFDLFARGTSIYY